MKEKKKEKGQHLNRALQDENSIFKLQMLRKIDLGYRKHTCDFLWKADTVYNGKNLNHLSKNVGIFVPISTKK